MSKQEQDWIQRRLQVTMMDIVERKTELENLYTRQADLREQLKKSSGQSDSASVPDTPKDDVGAVGADSCETGGSDCKKRKLTDQPESKPEGLPGNTPV